MWLLDAALLDARAAHNRAEHRAALDLDEPLGVDDMQFFD
jgi:hypothetical protein